MSGKPEQRPDLTPQMAELLSGPFDNYIDYFQGFAQQNFPHLNLVMLDNNDPLRDQKLRQQIRGQLDRPEIMQRLGGSMTYTEAEVGFNQYADSIIKSIHASDNRNAAYYKELGLTSTIVGTYQPNFPDTLIQQLGAQVSPILLNGKHCISCTSEDKLTKLACDDVTAQPKAMDQLARFETGFHELAHAIELHGSTLPGVILENIFSNVDYRNKSEGLAKSFAHLMMVREFGSLGADHQELKVHGPNLSPAHTTFRTAEATRDWLQSNGSRLAQMTPQEIFDVAQKLSAATALTPQEMKEAETYHRNYNSSDKMTYAAVTERLAAHERHVMGLGPAVPHYSDTGAGIDREFLRVVQSYDKLTKRMEQSLQTAQACFAPTAVTEDAIDTSSLNSALQNPGTTTAETAKASPPQRPKPAF